MLVPAALPTPLVTVDDPELAAAGVELRLKRDDLAHPAVPGNKWRKLAPNLEQALAQGRRGLLTYGGAYSTHVRAVAAAAKALGLASVGVIRGAELAEAPRNWSLARAERDGMVLEFVERSRYREVADGRREAREGYLVLPEGGSNALAVHGAAVVGAELAGQLPGGPDGQDVVCCPVGTGGTLAGIAAGLPAGVQALGVAVLRGGEGYLEREVTALHQAAYGREFDNWRVVHGWHGGGYGRVPAVLERFAARFESAHGVPVERRYVAKALWAVYGLAQAGELTGRRVTVVVTGVPDPQG
ncbi:1-aminocyclopropane-1-carboxylate deaminase/D-cysteine desulfhydrase [Streptomyces sp. TLI_171]|uniref:1-aminocyclopropane-1-carboxylate deaminase/D-cysteine desulfhydrase n=1 Tax=Streptomyces sp. TLI_171 TaxID=1938859 RepID=UPI000C18D20E|nr:pyridoxal-phosphate dependent enzyme [Streptomyces sp. TLI_171]RKE18968.1 1-aminocyclopropane-1-carboxylate deaminase/D-cysteine desulfhydrase-like pyridoxal-dependent ACC family enzyme [Streptomyces sp. TLI_171]